MRWGSEATLPSLLEACTVTLYLGGGVAGTEEGAGRAGGDRNRSGAENPVSLPEKGGGGHGPPQGFPRAFLTGEATPRSLGQ